MYKKPLSQSKEHSQFELIIIVLLVLSFVTINCSAAGVFQTDMKLFEYDIDNLTENGTISDKSILVKIDHEIGQIISIHVNKILKVGYAQDLSSLDFFHGHFRIADLKVCPEDGNFSVKGPRSIYGNIPRHLGKDKWIELFLNSDPYFLYHTRENTVADWKTIKESEEEWEREIKYIGSSPRSIVGDKNGEIFIIEDSTKTFRRYGAADALVESKINGIKTNRMCSAMKYIYQRFGNFRIKFGSMFLVLRDHKGRFLTTKNVSYDIFYLGDSISEFKE